MKHIQLNNNDIKGLTQKICREIHLAEWRPDYIIGITRGGLIPAVMLSHWLNVPMYTLKISLRDGKHNESIEWMSKNAIGYCEQNSLDDTEFLLDRQTCKNILIVDDINDSGSTFNWLIDNWQSTCCPTEIAAWHTIWNNNVKFAVLVNNITSNFRVNIDFFGLEVSRAKEDFWIDFPWETWWTND